jgi:hypothetical protein
MMLSIVFSPTGRSHRLGECARQRERKSMRLFLTPSTKLPPASPPMTPCCLCVIGRSPLWWPSSRSFSGSIRCPCPLSCLAYSWFPADGADVVSGIDTMLRNIENGSERRRAWLTNSGSRRSVGQGCGRGGSRRMVKPSSPAATTNND